MKSRENKKDSKQGTMVQKGHESRRNYWETRSSVHLFAHSLPPLCWLCLHAPLHSFVCLLAQSLPNSLSQYDLFLSHSEGALCTKRPTAVIVETEKGTKNASCSKRLSAVIVKTRPLHRGGQERGKK